MAHTSREELLAKLEKAKAVVQEGEIWQHTKTQGRYTIELIGIDEGTERVKVAYKELDHEPAITWYRFFDGEDGWITPTEIDGLPVPRFTKLS